jgi:hypothetical protein
MPNGRTLAWIGGIALLVVLAHDKYSKQRAG